MTPSAKETGILCGTGVEGSDWRLFSVFGNLRLAALPPRYVVHTAVTISIEVRAKFILETIHRLFLDLFHEAIIIPLGSAPRA